MQSEIKNNYIHTNFDSFEPTGDFKIWVDKQKSQSFAEGKKQGVIKTVDTLEKHIYFREKQQVEDGLILGKESFCVDIKLCLQSLKIQAEQSLAEGK